VNKIARRHIFKITTVSLIILTLSLLLFSGCGPLRIQAAEDQKKAAEERKAKEDNHQATANRVVSGILYIKDPRSGLCFAYYWGGQMNGGPALAAVPENAIPPELLLTAKIPAK